MACRCATPRQITSFNWQKLHFLKLWKSTITRKPQATPLENLFSKIHMLSRCATRRKKNIFPGKNSIFRNFRRSTTNRKPEATPLERLFPNHCFETASQEFTCCLVARHVGKKTFSLAKNSIFCNSRYVGKKNIFPGKNCIS